MVVLETRFRQAWKRGLESKTLHSAGNSAIEADSVIKRNSLPKFSAASCQQELLHAADETCGQAVLICTCGMSRVSMIRLSLQRDEFGVELPPQVMMSLNRTFPLSRKGSHSS